VYYSHRVSYCDYDNELMIVFLCLVVLSLLAHPNPGTLVSVCPPFELSSSPPITDIFVQILLPSSWLSGRIEPRPTRFMGGVPGYTVFDNLWFNDGVFRKFRLPLMHLLEFRNSTGLMGRLLFG
jgi:hypothetical protein